MEWLIKPIFQRKKEIMLSDRKHSTVNMMLIANTMAIALFNQYLFDSQLKQPKVDLQ